MQGSLSIKNPFNSLLSERKIKKIAMRQSCSKIGLYLFLLLYFQGIVVFAYAGGFVARPHAGLGYLSTPGTNEGSSVSHVGGRLLLSADGSRKFGLEATYFHLNTEDNHVCLGIILENKNWQWFNMSIGTVGFFHFRATSDNPVGLTTNLGWEPERFKQIKPFITYRMDIIFHSQTAITQSLSVGLSW